MPVESDWEMRSLSSWGCWVSGIHYLSSLPKQNLLNSSIQTKRANNTQRCSTEIQNALRAVLFFRLFVQIYILGLRFHPLHTFPQKQNKVLFLIYQLTGKIIILICLSLHLCVWESIWPKCSRPVLLFILVWILFQPTDTCQTYTHTTCSTSLHVLPL